MTASNGKKTILFMTDCAGTGFGRVGDEIVKRFAKTGIYNCVYVGWAGHNSIELYEKWKQYGVIVQMTQFNHNDQFGQETLPLVIRKYNPDIIWTLGDPWMVEHVARAPGAFERWKWISYVPIDRDVLCPEWLPSLKAPDVLVLYSKFGMEVVKKHLPRLSPELIYHGVDTDIFHPVDKSEAKKSLGIHPNTFVVGYVGRNQIRKRIPRLMRAFSFWNDETYCTNAEIKIKSPAGYTEVWNARDYVKNKLLMRREKWEHFKQDPKKYNSALYLHTTQGYTDNNDGLWVGWHLSEYSRRYGLDENGWGAPSRVMLPDPNIVKTTHGLPDEHLNTVYNIMDVQVIPSNREGFCLPILEAASCGVPSIVTNYSSMPELVADGRGIAVDPTDFDDEPFWDAPGAMIGIEGLVDALDQTVALHSTGEWGGMKKKCRQFAVENDWNKTFMQFNRIVRELLA